MIPPPLNKYIARLDHLGVYLTSGYHQPLAMKVFVKALAVFILLKTVLLRDIIIDIITYHQADLPHSGIGRLLLAPTFLAFNHPDIFIGVIVLSCLAILMVPVSYVLNAWLFFIVLNLYVLLIPVGDDRQYTPRIPPIGQIE